MPSSAALCSSSRVQVISLCFVNSAMMALLPVCRDTCLVVDCGYTETSVFAIASGHPILRSLTIVPQASRAIHEYVCVAV